MNLLIEIIKVVFSPPVVAVVLGGLIFQRINESRIKRSKLRDEQIAFIGDVAGAVHKIFPLIFAEIKNGTFGKSNVDEINKLKRELFEVRLIVRVKSEAFFGSNNFSKSYEDVMWELDKIIGFLQETTKLDKYFGISFSEL